MPGPCPNGRPTAQAHRDSKCAERERCTGPGCRVYRAPRERKQESDALPEGE